jgi:SAM-dependent methyltransferase
MEQETSKDERMRAFFEELWHKDDPWSLETSEFERAKYARQIQLLADRRFERVLEIGCGAGVFTALLTRQADYVMGIDISPTAISMAKRRLGASTIAEFREANVMEEELRDLGSWELIVMSETVCYLGWLYSFFDIAWLASEIFHSTRDRGLLLMANTLGEFGDYLLSPWIIRTYRDLFVNVGYSVATEETFQGSKNGVKLDVLISLFQKR